MDLDRRKQVQAQASDDVKAPDHVPEQIRYDRVMADELIAGRRIARRRLFLCDLDPVVRLPVFDVRTLPEEVASYDAIPLAGIKPLSIRVHVARAGRPEARSRG